MARLSDADRRQLRDAVRAAETRTRAEFVMVIARRADPYFFPPMALAAGVALALPGVLWVASLATDFLTLYEIQLAAFVVLFPILRLPAVLPHIVPRPVRLARAKRLAQESFHRLGLHRTRERSGVLIFVALAEHYVEIIADEGADNAVPDKTWQDIIDATTAKVRADGPAQGFLLALASLGEILGQALPRRPDDSNEIADRLIEI